MSKPDTITGKVPMPRFEFRAFGQNFDHAAKRMARLSMPVPEKLWEINSEEVYIISKANDIQNIKIRSGKIDVKTYIKTKEGMELWAPTVALEFPIKTAPVMQKIISGLIVGLPELEGEYYDYDRFIELINKHPELQAVRVIKQRSQYMVNNTICETAEVLINGARVVTISSESAEIQDIKQTITEIGLDGIENINYLQAIKRVIGMSDKKLAN